MFYEPNESPKKVIKGLKSMRSDTVPVAKNLQEKVIDCILKDTNTTELKRMVTDEYQRIARGDVSLQEITTRKKLTREIFEYKSKNLAHVVVAHQMMDAGQVVQTGDFIEYIITEGAGAKYKRAVIPSKYVNPDYHMYANDALKSIQQIINEPWVMNISRKRKRYK